MTRDPVDLLAIDLLAACPDCGDLAFPGATVCESCGTHLFVRQGAERPFEPVQQRLLSLPDVLKTRTEQQQRRRR